VAVGESDAIAVSTNPTGDAGDWRVVRPYDRAAETDDRCISAPPGSPPVEVPCPLPPRSRQVRAISCPSAGLCIAVTYDGYIYSSTDPTGPATSWRLADVDGSGRDTHLESISCPDPGFCAAVSGNDHNSGQVLTSTGPTGPGAAWQVTQLDESLDLRGISCPARTFCLAVASNGRIVRSTNPSGGASAWEEIGAPGGPGDLEAVACVDAGSFLCLTGNSGGNLLTTSTPGAAAPGWSEVNGGGSVQITGVSCPTPSRCAAVDNNGDVLVSTEPSRSWAISNLTPFIPREKGLLPLNGLFATSCPTVALCLAVGAKGRVFVNVDPFAAASALPDRGKSAGGGKHRRAPRRPKTTLLKADGRGKATPRRFRARFRFHANGRVRGFVCKRDRGPYRSCRSPLRYWVPLGPHVLQVRAIGLTGLRGPVAMIRFYANPKPTLDRPPAALLRRHP
jgi:hypothetical protein